MLYIYFNNNTSCKYYLSMLFLQKARWKTMQSHLFENTRHEFYCHRPPLMNSASVPAGLCPSRCRSWSCRCGRQSQLWCPGGCSSGAPQTTHPWERQHPHAVEMGLHHFLLCSSDMLHRRQISFVPEDRVYVSTNKAHLGSPSWL